MTLKNDSDLEVGLPEITILKPVLRTANPPGVYK